MGRLLEIVTPLHRRTRRDYLARMQDDKVACMRKAREYGAEYWDGDRRFGYGGYRYDGRWKPVAERLVELYGLKPGHRVLDVGCGKAHVLHELEKLVPDLQVVGVDISQHAVAEARTLVKGTVLQGRAQDRYPWGDQSFDLVFSLNCLHNLRLHEIKAALGEIERVGKQKFVLVESYHNEEELFNLQCWALTAESFFETSEWIWLYEHFGYRGDYEFIYFE